jgi:hypothetical protein
MFIDPSSGRGDSFTASVCHVEPDGLIVQDALLEIIAPFNPSEAVAQVRDLYRSYGITSPIVTDRYAVGWVAEALSKEGLPHQHSSRDRSAIYLGAAPFFTSGKVRLLSNPRLLSQLSGLIRRVSPSGRDTVNHVGANTHDDLANSTCGSILLPSDMATRPSEIIPVWVCDGRSDPIWDRWSPNWGGAVALSGGADFARDTFTGTSRWLRQQRGES